MATAFGVLAEPSRRRILDLLLEQPRAVGELTGLLGISQPGTSKHLRVLREAGLVRVRRDAQRRWYELRPGPLAERYGREHGHGQRLAFSPGRVP